MLARISNGEMCIVIAAGAQYRVHQRIKAPDPYHMLEEMIASVRRAWDKTH
jgi:hypothetical protein